MMKKVIFYEKTGCAGNARQKKLLKSYGIELQVKSLLDEAWEADVLERFFEGLSTSSMVNPFAPKIKNKEIDAALLSKKELISLMIKEPLLIKRPLIQIDEVQICGFDIAKLNEILEIKIDENKDVSSCSGHDKCN